MNFLQPLIFVSLTLAWPVANAQAAVSGESVNVSSEEETSASFQAHPEAEISFGSTSNATQLTQPTPGTFAKITPNLSLEWTPSDSFFSSLTVGGTIKRYTDSQVGSLADQTGVSAKSDSTWYLREHWEIGTNLSFNYLKNSIPVVSLQSVSAIPQQYYEPDARLYTAWIGDNWAFEGGFSGATRRYDTTTFDIQGNVYRNTYNTYKFDGKIGYRFSQNLRLALKSSIERRYYQERMAEFTDGLPVFPGTTNPLLQVLTQEHEVQLKSKVSSISLTTGVSAKYEKDEIFAARDSLQFRLRQKASIPLPLRLSLDPEVSISRQGFFNFRSDPMLDPQASPLRTDWETQISSALSYPLTQLFKVHALYAYNRRISNYSLQNYLEHIFEAGMNVQF